jgi:radical SAM superfamily enzyme YgiQ (UPF0313 family)/phosphatidylglycerophosphate synthase
VKILFINPPSSYSSYVPPLGVCYISSVLKQKGYQVFGLDAASLHNRLSISQIVKKVKEISPDVIGVTLNLYFIKGGYALAKELEGLSIPLVAGGPHPRVRPFEVIEHGFDIACEGEGEETFLEILDYIKGKKPLRDILGITYRAPNGLVLKNPSRPLIEDLNSLPFPDRTLFPLENYFLKSTIKQKKFYFQVFSSRGCPYRCTFCAVSSRKIRVRTPQNLYDEVENLVKTYGINYIQFMDDIFTANKKWLYQFFDELEKRNLDIKWDCESRVDCVDEDLLYRMKKAGLNCIFYGVESGDPQTLKLIKKGVKLEQIRRTLDITAKIKIPSVKINFILGFPWENKTHILNSYRIMRDYRKSLRIRNGITVPIPYPGTELYNEFKQECGFAEWWLKDDAFEHMVVNEGAVPYYKKNPLNADKFWLDKNFFRYPKSFRRFLSRIILKNEKIAYQSYYGFLKTETVFWGSYLSLVLNKINPRLENIIFFLLSKVKKFIIVPWININNFVIRSVKPLTELKTKYRSQHDRERNFDWVERNIYASLAMPILKILLPTRINANQVTIASLLIGLSGCLFLMIPRFIWGFIGIVFLQLSYILDYVDGALARAKDQVSKKGAFLEKLFSLILGTAIFFSVGFACFFRFYKLIYIILGITAGMSFFLIRYFYDAQIIFKTNRIDDSKVKYSNHGPVADIIFKRIVNRFFSPFKTLARKTDFLWIPIYFIDFIALAFLTNKLFVFVWFYGIFYPVITVATYITQSKNKIGRLKSIA